MPVVEVVGVQESDGEINKTLPPGVYPAIIDSCEWSEVSKPDSNIKGAKMLMLTYKVTDPESQITVNVRDSIILPHPNSDAESVRKSLAKLKRLQLATGLADMGNAIDNEAFMYAEFMCEVYEQDDKTYGKQNRAKDYLPR